MNKVDNPSELNHICPICQCGEAKTFYLTNTSDNKEAVRLFVNRKIIRCKDCNIKYISPMPSHKDLDSFYQNYRKGEKKLLNESTYNRWGYDWDIRYCSKSMAALSFITAHLSNQLKNKDLEILELGPGLGNLLKAIKIFYPRANLSAFEADQSVYHYLTLLGVNTKNKCFKADEVNNINNKYHLIIMQMVFEHIPDPINFMNAIKEILHPGAYIFIQVPNYNDDVFNLRRTDDAHLLYLGQQELETFFQKMGFKQIANVTSGPKWGESINPYILDTKKGFRRFFKKIINKIYSRIIFPIYAPSINQHWYEDYVSHENGNTIQAIFQLSN